DEVGQVWGDGRIEVDELLAILHVPAGHDLVLEREDEPDKILRPAARCRSRLAASSTSSRGARNGRTSCW
ncbi:DUF2070 family protein, partial [Klebsiella pneumoniae]|nr:DUF2070 family protein [Klebsiella pneumoniae]